MSYSSHKSYRKANEHVEKQLMSAKTKKKTIHVGYVARVEGEAAIHVVVAGHEAEAVELRIWEPPRFFEGFMVGRSYSEAPDIVARICGICPVSHMSTAIRALEKAMGVEPSPQTLLLRRLLAMSQLVSSHVVHLYALALPDYEGYAGLPAMLGKYPQVVQRLNRMRLPLNDLTRLVGGGRGLHPIGTVVGGFTRIPSREQFRASRDALISIRQDAVETLKMVADFEDPGFTQDREFVCIRNEEVYAIEIGDIVSNRGMRISEDDYYKKFFEFQMPYANTKQTRLNQTDPIMVGSLARLNIKYDQLLPEAKSLAEKVGFRVPDYNPFHNNLAQAIEIVHGLEDCIQMIESLDPKDEKPFVRVRAGEGGAITEAPRGLLHHFYAVNRRGVVEKANIVTPTAHNFMMIERDLRGMTEAIADRPMKEIRRSCEMLVRAYDPCFSCSVH